MLPLSHLWTGRMVVSEERTISRDARRQGESRRDGLAWRQLRRQGRVKHSLVDLTGLLPDTRTAIAYWSLRNDLDDHIGDRGWLAPEWASFLYFALEAEDDAPEYFPHGKWATLQYIHARIAEAQKREEE
jgi:hypothetical protein